MEFVAKPISLKPDTEAMLEDMRHSQDPTIAYGLEPEAAQQLVKGITDPVLEGAALPLVVLNEYRWYCRELGRLFRTKYGYALAFQLELVLRKWKALGLEANALQYLACEVYRQLLVRQADAMREAGERDDRPEEQTA